MTEEWANNPINPQEPAEAEGVQPPHPEEPAEGSAEDVEHLLPSEQGRDFFQRVIAAFAVTEMPVL